MNSRNRLSNRRRSKGNLHKMQGLLEVKVRSELATRQRNRTILVWMCKIILAVGMVGGGMYGGRELINRLFLKNASYNLAAVEINDDGAALTREVILSTANLQLGENIFSVSLSKARDAILTLPQVERVDLQRSLPNRIVVEIVERRPVAWLADAKTADPSTSEKSFLIDSKGVLFKPKRQLPEYLRLPAIYGAPLDNYLAGDTVGTPEVTAALELVQKNSDSNRFRLQSVDLSKGYCLIATDARRAKLTFGLDNIENQLDRLGAVLDYATSQGKEIRTVNLMVEKNIPAVLADPAAVQAEIAPAQDDTAKTAAATPAPSAKPGASPAASKPNATPASASVPGEKIAAKSKKKTTVASSSTPNVRRAEPGVHKAEPVVKKAEPVIKRAEPVIKRAQPVSSN
ncbi:MAG: cell division protein FtsQ/DivIB [Chthoniobacteraceae bacterium]